MRLLGTLSLIVCLAAASGCNICCWGKRATELESPTDIRKSHYWCLGEDAVFAQPMGPSREDYGLKPTCWREWPAGGARCIENGCGPTMGPDDHFNGSVPTPAWEQAVPSGTGQGGNPFRDDTKLLPAPSGTGAQLRGTTPNERRQTRIPATSGLSASANALPARRNANGVNPIAQNTATNYSQRPAAAPRIQPAQSTPQPPREGPSLRQPPVKITVSEPIDMPVRYLAPGESPRGAAGSAVATRSRPVTVAKTLASLEQLIEVPASAAPTTALGSTVIRNDFAPAPQPFRLATRSSLVRDASDPLLEKKTLSALGAMMSPDARPASVRR